MGKVRVTVVPFYGADIEMDVESEVDLREFAANFSDNIVQAITNVLMEDRKNGGFVAVPIGNISRITMKSL